MEDGMDLKTDASALFAWSRELRVATAPALVENRILKRPADSVLVWDNEIDRFGELG
jgi:hypothetical protein